MTSIFPIPTGRTSDLLSQRRLEAQLASNQIALLRLQDQLATGRRISLPSDDPAAAQRALAIQRLLAQKTQARTNLAATQAFMAASETALAGVGGLLTDLRSAVLGASDSAHTDAERLAAAAQVEQTISRLAEIANQQFRGRSLFAGSNTALQPFAFTSGFVAYLGNEAQVRTLADLGNLFTSNVNGHAVFGGFSAESLGTADLNPSLTPETRLADLHGGAGVPRGSVKVSDGNTSRTIDLSTAETLADVVALLEANPPEGRSVSVQIAGDHLEISLDNQPGTNLTIQEIHGGQTAAALGIRAAGGVGNAPVIGQDLNPRLRSTTRLADLLGGAFDQASGLRISNGGQTVDVSFAGAQTIEDLLRALNESGAQVFAEINAAGNGLNIRSRLSGADFQIGENGGTTAAQLGVRTLTRDTRLSDLNYGRGVGLAQTGADFTIVRKDGVSLSVNLAGAQSIGDVIDLINNLPGNTDPATAVVARLAPFGNGIELSDANAGAAGTLEIHKGATSSAAWDLGLVPRDATSAAAIDQGGQDVLAGRDVNPRETPGVFNTLLRLQAALVAGDQVEIDRTLGMLGADLERVTSARAEIGMREQALEDLSNRLADEDVHLRDLLSREIDADLAVVISELASKQAAVEASLRMIGQTLRLTLLDFL